MGKKYQVLFANGEKRDLVCKAVDLEDRANVVCLRDEQGRDKHRKSLSVGMVPWTFSTLVFVNDRDIVELVPMRWEIIPYPSM